MALIKTMCLKYKLRKVRTLDDYINFVEKTDLSKIPELTACTDKSFDGSELKATSLDNMFTHLNSFDKLVEKYNLNSIADCDNDFENVIKLMGWFNDNTYYSGAQYKFLHDDTLEIFDFSFGKGFKNAINCRYKAIAFSDILVAVGIKAFPICLIDGNFDGCHLMCEVYLREQNKWIVVDPSFNAYFTDENGNVLDAFELRDYFLCGKAPEIIGYNFNGTDRCKDVYIKAFVKVCLSNISTWHDNSDKDRHNRKRKDFDYKVPDLH